jgi:hypothetical protein
MGRKGHPPGHDRAPDDAAAPPCRAAVWQRHIADRDVGADTPSTRVVHDVLLTDVGLPGINGQVPRRRRQGMARRVRGRIAARRLLASRLHAAIRRSEGVIPPSLAESNGMLSWRGTADGTAGAGEFLILLLLDDGRIVPGASPETALGQQLVVSQRRQRNARRAERHPSAGGRIQYPCRHHNDHAGCRLEGKQRIRLRAVRYADTERGAHSAPPKVGFAVDSPLEESGFELLVPP